MERLAHLGGACALTVFVGLSEGCGAKFTATDGEVTGDAGATSSDGEGGDNGSGTGNEGGIGGDGGTGNDGGRAASASASTSGSGASSSGTDSSGDGGAAQGGTGGMATSGAGASGQGGSGGTTAGAGAGAMGGGGSGGMASDPECVFSNDVIVVFDETFDTDVFGTTSWDRTDTSVNVSGGYLTIAPDDAYDDFAEIELSGAMPLVIEARLHNVPPSGVPDWLPVVETFYGDTSTKVAITYYSTEGYGWVIDAGGGWSGSHVNAPSADGEWMTVRAFIRSDGGALCTKSDAQAGFTLVATKTWSLPGGLIRLRARQSYDASAEFDWIRIVSLDL
jgi:hypothetical protein